MAETAKSMDVRYAWSAVGLKVCTRRELLWGLEGVSVLIFSDSVSCEVMFTVVNGLKAIWK